jgi:hypothetical protein
MNLLTTRKLPMWVTPASDNLNFRIDRNLVRLVHNAVSLQHQRLRVGKRFALEFALTQWLHSEGLLKEGLDIPAIFGDENGNHE